MYLHMYVRVNGVDILVYVAWIIKCDHDRFSNAIRIIIIKNIIKIN